MAQDTAVYDLLRMLEVTIDDGISLLHYTVVDKRQIEDLIDKIYQAIPNELQEARVFLRDKEKHLNDVQQKANKIIQDAQTVADRKLSESDQIKAIQMEGNRIRNEVADECEKIKHIACQDAQNIRMQATEEAVKTRENAELYAEQILANLEGNLNQLQQVVKNGQIYLEQLRNDSSARYSAQNQQVRR